jgi:hypothetical protein
VQCVAGSAVVAVRALGPGEARSSGHQGELLTHSLTHSLTHHLTHSLSHSLTTSPPHYLTHLLTHYLTHLLTYSLTHSLTHSLTPNKQAVHQIKNAKILKCEHQGKPYSLSLYCEGKKAPLYIDCGKEKNRSEWSDALVKAAVSHEMMERRAASVRAHMSTLGIPLDTELTPRLVSRAYKKLCLKVL